MSIVAKNLNKVYKNRVHALENVNLNIESGMFGLLGQNGAGKSTLMKILTTLIKPTSGSIEICGRKLNKKTKCISNLLQVICHRSLASIAALKLMNA